MRRRRHRAHVHDMDVLWWFCDDEGCEHNTKSNSKITKHKATRHNLGDVPWKECPQCDYKAKTAGNVNRQMKQCN